MAGTPAIHIIVVVVSPTTLPAPARVRRGDDRSEIADVHLAAEHRHRHRAADHRRGDIVEEARQHEDHHEQDERAFPVAGQEARQERGNAAVLEVLGKQREAEQEPQQIREDHPFVQQMQPEAGESRARLEAREQKLVEDDRGETDQRDFERVMMEQRDAEQREREKNEIDRDAEDLRQCAGARVGALRERREQRERPGERNCGPVHHFTSVTGTVDR